GRRPLARRDLLRGGAQRAAVGHDRRVRQRARVPVPRRAARRAPRARGGRRRGGAAPAAAMTASPSSGMRYRRLGASDLHVSEIALGSWLTFGTHVERDAARVCLDRALGAGVNFIDTANVYGHGAAETFLGDALAGRARDSYVLATKLFFPMDDGDRGLSAAQVRKQLDASLRRLRTDHVDL